MSKQRDYLIYSIQKVSKGLIGIEHRYYGRQFWAKAKTRKNHRCVMTDTIIKKGEFAYRPITNAGNRYERIHLCFFKANQ